jgi:Ni/Co efflux regulator RcnB
MKPLTTKLSAIAAVAVMGLGTAGAAQARHGADDPAGHQRHGRGADDAQPHARHGADDRAGHRRHHHRHGHDDGPNHR